MKIQNIPITSESSLCSFPSSLPSSTPNHCFDLLPEISFTCSRTSTKWSSAIYAILRKASFTEANVFEIHSCCVYQRFIPFHC